MSTSEDDPSPVLGVLADWLYSWAVSSMRMRPAEEHRSSTRAELSCAGCGGWAPPGRRWCCAGGAELVVLCRCYAGAVQVLSPPRCPSPPRLPPPIRLTPRPPLRAPQPTPGPTPACLRVVNRNRRQLTPFTDPRVQCLSHHSPRLTTNPLLPPSLA